MPEEVMPEDPISPDETLSTVLDEGVEAMKKVWAIEREMLSRAIVVINRLTDKTPEEIITLLSKDIDEAYQSNIGTVQTAAKVSRLYLPRSEF